MRPRHLAIALIAGLTLGALMGCSGLSINASAPAFVKDVDLERADREAADAKIREDLGGAIELVRTDTNGSIEQLRADVVATRTAGEKAFADAIASGASLGDATAARVRAETALAIQTATDAMAKSKADTENALAKSKAETTAAIAEADQRSKAARDAAQGAQEGSPGWLTLVLGLLGTTGIGGVIAKLMLTSYDKKPFVGSDGTTIAEGPLVDALARALGGGKPAAPPAG